MVVREAIAAALGVVPVAGGSMSAIFNEAFQGPLTRRREDFFNRVAWEVAAVSARVDGLRDDDEFVDALVVATQVAVSAGQEQKRQWQASGVANCARRSGPGHGAVAVSADD